MTLTFSRTNLKVVHFKSRGHGHFDIGHVLFKNVFIWNIFLLAYSIQGVPPYRGKCISSILAPLNVIKTTSLIISCTKPLHNSFCMHFDAFWCILMHLEHSDVNMLFLTSNSPFLAHLDIQEHFYDRFLHKIFLQFILHTFSCIVIHSDAFWAIKINKNHFFW